MPIPIVHGTYEFDTQRKWCEICNRWINIEEIKDLGHTHFMENNPLENWTKNKAKQISIQETLKERNNTHGSFKKNASVSQLMKAIIRKENQSLSCSQIEALDMICLKISRIVTGNCNEIDHWHDIAGYATLIENELRQRETKNFIRQQALTKEEIEKQLGKKIGEI